MSIMQTLKLTAVTRAISSPEQRSRMKLLAYLGEQKALAEATIAGTPFHASRMVTRRNEAGEKVRVEAPRHVRKAWFNDPAGKLYLQVRYGSKPLELAKGKNAVEVGGMQEIPTVLDSIMAAVGAGELDGQLAAAAAERKAKFKRNSAGKSAKGSSSEA